MAQQYWIDPNEEEDKNKYSNSWDNNQPSPLQPNKNGAVDAMRWQAQAPSAPKNPNDYSNAWDNNQPSPLSVKPKISGDPFAGLPMPATGGAAKTITPPAPRVGNPPQQGGGGGATAAPKKATAPIYVRASGDKPTLLPTAKSFWGGDSAPQPTSYVRASGSKPTLLSTGKGVYDDWFDNATASTAGYGAGSGGGDGTQPVGGEGISADNLPSLKSSAATDPNQKSNAPALGNTGGLLVPDNAKPYGLGRGGDTTQPVGEGGSVENTPAFDPKTGTPIDQKKGAAGASPTSPTNPTAPTSPATPSSGSTGNAPRIVGADAGGAPILDWGTVDPTDPPDFAALAAQTGYDREYMKNSWLEATHQFTMPAPKPKQAATPAATAATPSPEAMGEASASGTTDTYAGGSPNFDETGDLPPDENVDAYYSKASGGQPRGGVGRGGDGTDRHGHGRGRDGRVGGDYAPPEEDVEPEVDFMSLDPEDEMPMEDGRVPADGFRDIIKSVKNDPTPFGKSFVDTLKAWQGTTVSQQGILQVMQDLGIDKLAAKYRPVAQFYAMAQNGIFAPNTVKLAEELGNWFAWQGRQKKSKTSPTPPNQGKAPPKRK